MAVRSLRSNDLHHTAKTSLKEATSAKAGFELQFDMNVGIELHGGFALEPVQASLLRAALYTILGLHTVSYR